jgi:hypothetical protein
MLHDLLRFSRSVVCIVVPKIVGDPETFHQCNAANPGVVLARL